MLDLVGGLKYNEARRVIASTLGSPSHRRLKEEQAFRKTSFFCTS
jgi:hypothetical protein